MPQRRSIRDIAGCLFAASKQEYQTLQRNRIYTASEVRYARCERLAVSVLNLARWEPLKLSNERENEANSDQ